MYTQKTVHKIVERYISHGYKISCSNVGGNTMNGCQLWVLVGAPVYGLSTL